jgi:hypothetical protein
MTTWRERENERIDMQCLYARLEIMKLGQKAIKAINAKKCYVARSIGQQRRFSKTINGGKTK